MYIVAREKPCKYDRKFAIYERQSYRCNGKVMKSETYLMILHYKELDSLGELVPPTTEEKIVGAIERLIERKRKKMQKQMENI